jgi:hypothetical protein
MSVIGRNVGVIALGMSCQNSVQIRDNAELLGRLTGDPTLTESHLPFDSVLLRPDSVAMMLRDESFYPPQGSDIEVVEKYGGAYWPPYNAYFRHEYHLKKSRPIEYWIRGRLNLKRAHRELTGKFAHLTEKFKKLKDLERLVFVYTNMQNDLHQYLVEVGIDYRFDIKSVEWMCDECDRYFGRRCEYIFASYDERIDGRSRRDGLSVNIFAPDDSQWVGDRQQWKDMFERYFARAPALAANS